MYLIYKHINKANGLIYIGQTIKTIEERYLCDVEAAWNCLKFGLKPRDFIKAIIEFGADNFDHVILEDNLKTQAITNEREIYWIAYYKAQDIKIGYNRNKGGGNNKIKFIPITKHPNFEKLNKDWDYDKNNKLAIFPKNVSKGSSLLIWWKCSECNYEFKGHISDRLNSKKGCAKCLNRHRPIFTLDYAEKLILEYYNKYKSWPTCHSGQIEEDIDGGRAWCNLTKWVSQQNTNWPELCKKLGKKDLLPYIEGKMAAQSLKLKNFKEWMAYVKTEHFKDLNIPSNPDKHYEEFEGYGKWLGTNNIRYTLNNCQSYSEGKNTACSLNLKSNKQWIEFVKTEEFKKLHLPTHPELYYEEWESWGTWLGTDNVKCTKKIEEVEANVFK